MTVMDLEFVTTGESMLDDRDVLELLERGKVWLAWALREDADIEDIVAYKARALDLSKLTLRQNMGRDAVLAATELVRRAERAIGQAIRQGQQDGTILRQREVAGVRNQHMPQVNATEGAHKRSPTQFVSKGELSNGNGGIYALTDGTTDEQFERVLAACRAEGVLSRANVTRKIRNLTPVERPAPHRTRRFDSATIIEKTVQAAADVITHSLLDEVYFAELDAQDLASWVSSLADSIKALHGLKQRLSKELTQRV